MSRASRTAALLPLTALVVALIALSSWGAAQQVALLGTAALHVAGGRVCFGLGPEALVATESGELVGALESSPGTPWRFGALASLSSDDEGRIYASELSPPQVVVFGLDRQHHQTITLQQPPDFSFESQPFAGKLAIGDTIGNHLRLVDATGRTITSRSYRYPNGLSRIRLPASSGGSPREVLVFAETGAHRMVALDENLIPVAVPVVERLNAYLSAGKRAGDGPGSFPHLIHARLADDGVLLATLCRTTAGDCVVARVRPGEGSVDLVADLGMVSALPGREDELKLAEVDLTSRGRLLIASPRLQTVVQVEGEGGPPPPGFCVSCLERELSEKAVEVGALQRGVTWSNGAWVGSFGDAEIRRRLEGIQRAWIFYERLERVGRAGTILVALVLLLALFLSRQAGVEGRPGAHLEAVWRRAIVPEAWNLALVGVAMAAGALPGAALGFLLLGTSGALAGGALAGTLAARLGAHRLVLPRRSTRSAEEAFALFLGPTSPLPLPLLEGETLRWATFAHRRSTETLGEALLDATLLDDPADALELLFPRLWLIARTSHRLLVTRTSVLGSPLEVIESHLVRECGDAAPGTLVLFTPGRTLRFQLPPGCSRPLLSISAERGATHCERCRRVLPGCDHHRVRGGVELALTLLFPGTGHLAQGRFGRARSLGVIALGFALAAIGAWLPQFWGTLPFNPWQYRSPLGGFLLVAIFALVDVRFHQLREKRLQLALARR